MPPKVGTILHAGNRPGDHWNHIHAEHDTIQMGWTDGTGRQPPSRNGRYINPGMTAGVRRLYQALEEHFGPGAYFDSPQAKDAAWTHMGGWNPRPIGGPIVRTVAEARRLSRRRWSKHSAWDALDIGPYYGTSQQKRFLDFLTGELGDIMDHQHQPMPAALPRDWAEGPWHRWVARSDTDPKSRGWTFYREDLSWVYDRVIAPMERRIADLEDEVKRLKQQPGGGGQVFGTVVKLTRP